MDAVRVNLGKEGERRTWLAGFLQFLVLYGTSCAYVLTTANSLRAILKANCYHKEGHQAPCSYGANLYMVLFGLVEIVMSFIPDLHDMLWVSVVAAIMSFTYSFIGLGLGIAKVIENRRIDTLRSHPPENRIMKKAFMVAIIMKTFFYLCCGCFGYAAFGNDTPGNLLIGFGFYEPYWLVAFANVCIILHLVGGYQIYSQPISVDRWCSRKIPNNRFVNKSYKVKLPLLSNFELNVFRFCFRTTYVISTTGIAILFPYFNQVLGVLGAINFWPLAIYFPVEMYLQQKKIGGWTRKWIVLIRMFSFVCFAVTVVGLVGSIQGIISEKLS
uniref:Amino acid permease 7 n=1 Tax=Cajanus cajan TaxID=3821 RepID=A0A151UAM2_CAJCA|nr:putative amino acid permease 7 [Cajanus cajan]